MRQLVLAMIAVFWAVGMVKASDYRTHSGYADFLAYADEKYELPKWVVDRHLKGVQKNQRTIDLISKPAEKTLTWYEYQRIFISKKLVRQGVQFWQENEQQLRLASSAYQVPVEIMLAILGVETRFGRNQGKFSVVESLATLAFDYPKRSPFFRGELATLIHLAHTQNLPIDGMLGSYAGAVGMPQFMPSSRLNFSVDFDDDGVVDLRSNPADVIGSVANYFHKHGWGLGAPVILPVEVKNEEKLEKYINKTLTPEYALSFWQKKGVTILGGRPDSLPENTLASLYGFKGADGVFDYWLGVNNFYVITRYNRSRLYAMTVYQLSKQLAEAMREADA